MCRNCKYWQRNLLYKVGENWYEVALPWDTIEDTKQSDFGLCTKAYQDNLLQVQLDGNFVDSVFYEGQMITGKRYKCDHFSQ